jgi:hypothetical protein
LFTGKLLYLVTRQHFYLENYHKQQNRENEKLGQFSDSTSIITVIKILEVPDKMKVPKF